MNQAVNELQQSETLSAHVVKVVRNYLQANNSKDAELNLYLIISLKLFVNI